MSEDRTHGWVRFQQRGDQYRWVITTGPRSTKILEVGDTFPTQAEAEADMRRVLAERGYTPELESFH